VPTFNEIWGDIRTRLAEGMEIRNWSYDHGYTGNLTRIERLNYDEVVVTGDRTTRPRSVARADFQKVFEFWDRYKQGLSSRDDIQNVSRNSTYIISILHWLEHLDQ
jgi:hypothetical protein